jgi:hypothetical protein
MVGVAVVSGGVLGQIVLVEHIAAPALRLLLVVPLGDIVDHVACRPVYKDGIGAIVQARHLQPRIFGQSALVGVDIGIGVG